MPGRIVGETVDKNGKRGFVLTLQAREQHIKRHKATSNICSNQGLCALRGLIFLTTLGKSGLAELAQLNRDKGEYAKSSADRHPRRHAAADRSRPSTSSPCCCRRLLHRLLRRC